MPNHDARAIANEFIRRRDSDAWPQQLPIQKLTYIAHGWNLAINKEPLIDEPPQAWDNGPVFRNIWRHVKNFGYKGRKCTLTDELSGDEFTARLTPNERQIIDHVWKKYGSMSPLELTNMTHQIGTPWYQAYFGDRRNAELSNEAIKDHYVQLALAGREHAV
jgi:uncharacterized phage-associated protein